MTCEHWWYAQPLDRDGTVRMDCQRCGAHQERRVRSTIRISFRWGSG